MLANLVSTGVRSVLVLAANLTIDFIKIVNSFVDLSNIKARIDLNYVKEKKRINLCF
jgi:hypothetical protein